MPKGPEEPSKIDYLKIQKISSSGKEDGGIYNIRGLVQDKRSGMDLIPPLKLDLRNLEGVYSDKGKENFITRLVKEVVSLRGELDRLKTEHGILNGLNDHLGTVAEQAKIDAARAKKEAQVLREENGRLLREREQLRASAQRLTESAQRVTARASGDLDPKGYCSILGIDPKLLRTLSSEKFDRLAASVHRAYSLALHPDLGGDPEAMKALNVAYDFLKNPQNRRTYGR